MFETAIMRDLGKVGLMIGNGFLILIILILIAIPIIYYIKFKIEQKQLKDGNYSY